MNSKLLHTPVGVRDIYGDECKNKLNVLDKIHSVFHSYGYDDIQTPTFEYFDIFNKERGSVASNNMYKFFDREGYTLVLRPDMTPSIARSAAKYFMDEEMPIRFCYVGNAYINNSEYQGKLKEFTQIGSELIGDDTSDADAEVISMVIDSLLSSGVKEFQLEIGHPEFFKGLIEQSGLSEEKTEQLRELIDNKKYFGIETVLEDTNIDKELFDIFVGFQDYFGNIDMILNLKKLDLNNRSLQALERLEKLYNILTVYGLEKYVSFDLSMLSMYEYYTGVVFKGYTYGTGDAIVTGGRYDNLLSQFGKNAPAIGFAVNLDRLMMAMERQHLLSENINDSKIVLYSENDREYAISYAKSLRDNGQKIIMVRKRSNHSLKDYKEYAKRYKVNEILFVENNNTTQINV
ncbi:MAG: ATP phosphoribosyltransferase regulatory subunit [Lachnospiraceae bacterium]|nr:ATP phosphoribosyltransferase regulatory subunit [Lachnospiraceae bacterium]